MGLDQAEQICTLSVHMFRCLCSTVQQHGSSLASVSSTNRRRAFFKDRPTDNKTDKTRNKCFYSKHKTCENYLFMRGYPVENTSTCIVTQAFSPKHQSLMDHSDLLRKLTTVSVMVFLNIFHQYKG